MTTPMTNEPDLDVTVRRLTANLAYAAEEQIGRQAIQRSKAYDR